MKIIVLIGYMIAFSVLAQGPVDGFFKGRRKLDFAFSAAYQYSDQYYAGTGLINYERKLTSLGLFGEYGLTESLDVIVNIPLINGSLQDGSLFIKKGFMFYPQGGKISIIPALGISAPLSGYETQSGQAIGQRAMQLQPRLVGQVERNGLFFQLQGGYNYTFEPVPSSIPVSCKIGLSRGNFYTDVWFDYQKGLGDKEYGVDMIESFRELYVTYSKIGGVIYYGFPQKSKRAWGVFLNGSYILDGVNIGKAFAVGAGVVCKFDFSEKTTP